MKNNFYRIFLSIKEHKKDTVLIFLIVFVLTCFTTIFYVFYLSSNQIIKSISDSVETTIEVDSDYLNGMSKANLAKELEGTGANFEDYKQYFINTVNNTLAYREYEGVVSADCVLYVSFITENIKQYDNQKTMVYASADKVTFDSDDYQMITGHFFDEKEMNGGYNYILAKSGQEIIIDEQTTKYIEVGDEVRFIIDDKEYTYTVIGTYYKTGGNDNLTNDHEIYALNSYFLLPMNDILDIVSNDNYLSCSKPYVVLKGSEAVNEVRSKINSDFISNKIKGSFNIINVPYSITVDDELIQNMSKPINDIKTLMQIISLIMIVIMFILLYSLTLYIVNNRRHDFGIFISLGQSKFKTISLYLLELLIIASLAFILSMPASIKIGNNVSDIMVNASLRKQEKLAILSNSEEEFNEYELGKQAYENFSLNIKFIDYIFIYGAYVSMIILSSCVSLIVISKIKPKELLKR